MKRMTIRAMMFCTVLAAAATAQAAAITSAKLTSLSAVVNTPDGPRQLAGLEVETEGLDEVTCRISMAGWAEPQVSTLRLPPGKQRRDLQIPMVAEAGTARVRLAGGQVTHEFETTLRPPRQWFVYLVQHTHTDIGYTWRQSEILPEHLRYIDEVLDLCDATDGHPDDARFRWTCEVSWTLREYLARRPAAQIERLRQRLAEGRLEMAGMFLNMSEIATESSLAASLQHIGRVSEQLGVPVRTAMQNDVNGAGWCLPDYFSGMGIRYLSMGINKTRSILPFDKPTAFWWESPSGKRTLAWRPDHYMTGNFWGIHDVNEEYFRPRFLDYLRSLEDRQYPFDRISVQYSGYFTDNSRPSARVSDAVKAWNEKYAWPRLRLATAGEFLEYVEKNHADALPVHRQAWPDWWTDGFGSAARETAESRDIHAGLHTTQGLLALAATLGADLSPEAPKRIAGVREGLLFYDEHTFGAAESIHNPMSSSSLLQWGEKASFVWEASKQAGMLREEAFGALGRYLPRSNDPALVVFNTLNWPRTGLVSVLLDSAVVQRGKQVQLVDLASGQPALVQGLQDGPHGTTAEIWAQDVPPLGYKAYRIEVLDQDRAPLPPHEAGPGKLENAHYALTLNPQTGAVVSLRDKRSGRELVDASAEWNLGQLIYERIEGTRDFDKPEAFRRTTVRDVKLVDGVAGPIFRSIGFEAAMDGCAEANGARGEIRLYEPARQIELRYTIRKSPVVEAEAVYVALPFRCPDGQVVYEAQGGCVTPGRDQIPGSSSDWHTVQRFAAVRSPESQIVCASNRIPLMQFGEINLGKWQPVARVAKPHLYSWVMNNYWFTNFRATQEGEFSWSYHLTSSSDASNAPATRFGWNTCVPMGARVILPGPANNQPAQRSMLRCDAPNLLLVETRPATAGDGIVLHWREIEGNPARLDMGNQPFSSAVQSVDEVNVLEQPLRRTASTISFKPYEVKLVKVTLR